MGWASALSVPAVLVTMLHALWRVRVRRSVRGIVAMAVVEPASVRVPERA